MRAPSYIGPIKSRFPLNLTYRKTEIHTDGHQRLQSSFATKKIRNVVKCSIFCSYDNKRNGMDTGKATLLEQQYAGIQGCDDGGLINFYQIILLVPKSNTKTCIFIYHFWCHYFILHYTIHLFVIIYENFRLFAASEFSIQAQVKC